MCLPAALPRRKGRVAPAATDLSPVAREYPSRARGEPFQAAALRLFYQGTRTTMRMRPGLESSCSAQLLHRPNR